MASRGVVLVVANLLYALTDPPIRWFDHFIRPCGSVEKWQSIIGLWCCSSSYMLHNGLRTLYFSQ